MASILLYQKYERLLDNLRRFSSLAVAFSGGADSALLLHSAQKVLPGRVLALFADSQVQAVGEVEHAERLAHEFGAVMNVLWFDVLAIPGFAENPENRCYLCKKSVFQSFLEYAGKKGITQLADGTNFDDAQTDRPGLQALRELGVSSPLAEAELTKPEVRRLSKEFNIPTWDRPSASCLATRIPHGHTIDTPKLKKIALVESWLHEHGFAGCRARLSNNVVYLEFVEGQSLSFLSAALHKELKKNLNSHGISKVFLDLSERAGIVT